MISIFFIYENCMISIFCQPGHFILLKLHEPSFLNKSCKGNDKNIIATMLEKKKTFYGKSEISML